MTRRRQAFALPADLSWDDAFRLEQAVRQLLIQAQRNGQPVSPGLRAVHEAATSHAIPRQPQTVSAGTTQSAQALLVTFSEAAELLGCSERTVSRRVADQVFLPVGKGSGVRLRRRRYRSLRLPGGSSMTVSSRTILDVISKPYGNATRGAAMFEAQQVNGSGPNRGTPAQRDFFDRLVNVQVQAQPDDTYSHPGTGVLPLRQKGPLTPVEVAWLQRLPMDPAQISYEDAQTLAAMAQSLQGDQANADSRRLVDSIWRPVKEIHDRNAAEVEVRNANRSTPQLPDATRALADAVASEQPSLLPHEAHARAADMVKQARSTVQQRQQLRVTEAQQKLDTLNQAAAQRTATVR